MGSILGPMWWMVCQYSAKPYHSWMNGGYRSLLSASLASCITIKIGMSPTKSEDKNCPVSFLASKYLFWTIYIVYIMLCSFSNRYFIITHQSRTKYHKPKFYLAPVKHTLNLSAGLHEIAIIIKTKHFPSFWLYVNLGYCSFISNYKIIMSNYISSQLSSKILFQKT